MYRGAEAVVTKRKLFGKAVMLKDRIEKSYRIKALDLKLRTERTRREARLLHKAKLAGVSAPSVLEVSKYGILMNFLEGKRFKKFDKRKAFAAGSALAKLHNSGIIHGDFTPANILFDGAKINVIDFGLGFFSTDVEDKAVDVLTMLKSIDAKVHGDFIRGYKKYSGYGRVLERVEQVKSRVRYA